MALEPPIFGGLLLRSALTGLSYAMELLSRRLRVELPETNDDHGQQNQWRYDYSDSCDHDCQQNKVYNFADLPHAEMFLQ